MAGSIPFTAPIPLYYNPRPCLIYCDPHNGSLSWRPMCLKLAKPRLCRVCALVYEEEARRQERLKRPQLRNISLQTRFMASGEENEYEDPL